MSNKMAYGENAKGAWVISALTLLRTGSTFRNKELLLPVVLGRERRVPKEGCFQ